MVDKIKAALAQYSMIQAGDSVIVALSGGADSVALLYAMLELKNELDIKLSACHVNHKLRGDESDSDEAFVRALCENLNVELTIRSIDVRAMQKKHQSIEETARNARYSFFSELVSRSERQYVATAHTASDNTETILLNLIRGTGLKGLCGIPPVRDGIIRPLILCEREEIEKYCGEKKISYVTDSTNLSDLFTRNKIRLSLIPLIKEINPSVDDCFTRMSEILRQDSDFLESLAQNHGYNVKVLNALEKPILTRIIIGLLSNNNVSPSNTRISQIIEIVKKQSGKINVEKHKFAVIEDETLKIVTIEQFYP